MSDLSPFDRARIDRIMAELERLGRQPEMDARRITELMKDGIRIARRAVGATDDEIEAEFMQHDAELAAHRNDSAEDFIAWVEAQ